MCASVYVCVQTALPLGVAVVLELGPGGGGAWRCGGVRGAALDWLRLWGRDDEGRSEVAGGELAPRGEGQTVSVHPHGLDGHLGNGDNGQSCAIGQLLCQLFYLLKKTVGSTFPYYKKR